MRWLFWILFIMALAIGVSLLASYNEGYVLIVRPPYRLEISLNFLLILVIFAFALLHLCLRLIHYTKRLPASVRIYKEQQRIKNSHTALVKSLYAMAEGQYMVAEEMSAKALTLGENAGLSALIAARASHKLKHKNQRDYYFAEAERLAPDTSIARLLLQAESQLDDRQYSNAISTLAKLYTIEPNYAPAMRIELKAQVQLNHWEQVLSILQHLEKNDGIEPWHLKEIRQQAHLHIIKRSADDLPALSAYWKKMPDEDRLNGSLAYLAAQLFIKESANPQYTGGHDYGNQAAEIIEMSLTKKWNSKLAALLGDCITSNPQKQLQQAEYWLLSHESDADLLLALGNMCVRLKLWGKAQSYLEASISTSPSAPAHLALAKLLENRGDDDAALQQYRHLAQFF